MDNQSDIITLKTIRRSIDEISLVSSEYITRSNCSKLLSYIDEKLKREQENNSPVCGDSVTAPNQDNVNHPPYYTWLKELCGIEVIDITRHMDFDLGCAIKYILRCGHKSEQGMSDKDKAIEDLKKAVWYVEDRIKTLEKQ